MKGLAITGVVIGHLGFWSIEVLMNYWHLPVFFFVSGYFRKRKHIDNPISYVKGRIKRLIIPFFLFGTASVLAHNILCSNGIIGGETRNLVETLHCLENVFVRFQAFEELTGTLWFLPTLFFVSVLTILAVSAVKLCGSRRYEFGGLICVVGCAGVILKLPAIYFMWHNMILCGLVFYGYVCSKYKLENIIKHPVVVAVSGILILGGFIFKGYVGCQISSINAISLWHPVLFLSGISIVYFISDLIKDKSVGLYFSRIGEHSFAIMALHFTAFKLVTMIHHQFDPDVQLSSFTTSKVDLLWWSPIYLLCGVAIPIICSGVYGKVKCMLSGKLQLGNG